MSSGWFGFLAATFSGHRASAILGTWLSVVADACFVAGRAVPATLGLGGLGTPVAANGAKAAWVDLTYFSGLGALIVYLAALRMGRLTVRRLRDVHRAPVTVIDQPSRRTAEPIHFAPASPVLYLPTADDGTAPQHRELVDRFRRRHTTAARR